MVAFTDGFEPDLTQPTQRGAFEMYRALKITDPVVPYKYGTIEIFQSLRKQYPLLKKLNVPEVRAEIQNYIYPETHSLLALAKKSVQARKVLENQYPQLKDRKKLHALLIEQKTLKPKLLLDLINVMAWDEKINRFSDGRAQIRAFEEGFETRDAIVKESGIAPSYEELVKSLRLKAPSFLPDDKTLRSLVDKEKRRMSREKKKSGPLVILKMRTVTMAEAMIRSCLEGSHCDRESLFREMDEGQIRFTLSDAQGNSFGNLTVVLGYAFKGDEKIKVAFLDKAEESSEDRFLVLLESARRVLLDTGYLLSIPKDLGWIDGITRSNTIRKIIEELPAFTNQTLELTSFAREKVEVRFSQAYSRVDEKLPVKPLLKIDLEEGASLTMVPQPPKWTLASVPLSKILHSTFEDKKGDLRSKQRYLAQMELLEKGNGIIDPDFDKQVDFWLRDDKTPLDLKRDLVSHHLIRRKLDETEKVFRALPFPQRADLISYWWRTPRFKAKLDTGEKEILFLIAANEKLLREFLQKKSPEKQFAIWEISKDSRPEDNETWLRVMIELSDQNTLQKIQAAVLTLSLPETIKTALLNETKQRVFPEEGEASASERSVSSLPEYSVRFSEDKTRIEWTKKEKKTDFFELPKETRERFSDCRLAALGGNDSAFATPIFVSSTYRPIVIQWVRPGKTIARLTVEGDGGPYQLKALPDGKLFLSSGKKAMWLQEGRLISEITLPNEAGTAEIGVYPDGKVVLDTSDGEGHSLEVLWLKEGSILTRLTQGENTPKVDHLTVTNDHRLLVEASDKTRTLVFKE